MEYVWVSLGTLFPIALFCLVQLVGERRGWRARRMLKIGVVASWLWWSVALAIAIRQGLVGLVVSALLLGAFLSLMYTLARWAWKDIWANYDRYLERKYRER